jgi:ParB family transcriptional regulator, chromosome partitioning protein
MTDTAPTTKVPQPGSDHPIGTLEHLDPATLDIGDNVRDEASLTKEFLASIAENGVLVPITGVRDRDNAAVVRVRNGQRRTLAAREVGLTTVPVYVLPSPIAAAGEESIDRIVHQIVTNDHKQDLTDAQRARGIQQMIGAGLSVTKVAKIYRACARVGAATRTELTRLIAEFAPTHNSSATTKDDQHNLAPHTTETSTQ